MKIIGIIPCRYAATRFPGKPLAKIFGKPMVQWVYEASLKSRFLSKVIIATDDRRIFNSAKSFGADVVMTPECNSGTDRVVFAARKIDCNIVVNIQGDEPLIKPGIIDSAINPLVNNKKISVSTIAVKFEKQKDILNPNNVKVIVDKSNFAVYFTRYPLLVQSCQYKHIGLYVFRKDFLLEFSKMKQTPFEIAEKLEQLRILENGYKIYVARTRYKTIGVDTPGDLNKVKKMLSSKY
ncbi:MAG: 3-deoxy-manno-octulosonate cytidylyltransferase [Elusimicrobia bacterium]|nr:3-deoxy-manno-octulosonate cytidylyltransferase [Elusimicrobiota bacterium]